MKIKDKKVIGMFALEPWIAEDEFMMLINSWSLFKGDPVLSQHSKAMVERLEELQGRPTFDDDIDELLVVALSNSIG